MKKSKKMVSRKWFLVFSIFFAVVALIFVSCGSFLFALLYGLLAAFMFYGFKNYSKIVENRRKETSEKIFVSQPTADTPASDPQNARQLFIEKQQAAFASQLKAVPLTPAATDPSAKLERLRLSDMPEIKYTAITASFNPDRLPSFVVIDTETNGIKIQGGRILELSAIRYEDFQPVAAWTSLVNPEKAILADATAVNGITDDMVAGAPTLAQVSASFIDFIGTSPLVGYNLPFDLKFLYSRGIDLTAQKRKYYDVLEVARRAFKKDEVFSYKLVDVSEACGIFPDSAHRSLADCFTTAQVFKYCIDRITDR